jgi:hypothetical protein
VATGYSSWAEVGNELRGHGVARVYVKQLAPRQDNEKNQVYLAKQKGASAFELIEHILPLEFAQRAASTSTAKAKSKAGEPVLEGTVPWHWVSRDGQAHLAPGTRAILYLQYPEIRLSGFIDGCRAHAPDAMRRDHLAPYGSRALAFGAGTSGEVFALVVTEKDDPALFSTDLNDGPPERNGKKRQSVMRIAGLLRHPRNTALYFFDVINDGIARLLDDLRVINASGWQPSQRLTKNKPAKPYRGTNGGGYTLESLLGIPSNPGKTPDRDGIEIKSFSSPKVSLMTPVPDGGYYRSAGFHDFVKTFGHADSKDPTRMVFNGTHICNKRHDTTGLMLCVTGYDPTTGFAGAEADVIVSLIQPTTGIVACSWSYPRLFESWNKKHSKAVYVSSERRGRDGDPAHDADYHFADKVWVCEGTSSRHLLNAIITGEVVYDPGDTTKSGKTQKPKARPQWRIRNVNTLSRLYDTVRAVAFP